MKNLLITGGHGEIGCAIAAEFSQQAFHIIAPLRQELDLRDPNSIENFIQKFQQPIDAFVYCAGINDPKAFIDISLDDLEQTLRVNAIGFYQLINGLLHQGCFEKPANILGISSIYGSLARKKRFSYVASKHCLNGMMKTLALELAPQGIKVNTLAPGFVATQLTYKNNSPQIIEKLIAKVPLAKLALPEDIAKIAYFLCSDNNRFITGQNIIADGGYSIGGFEEL